MVTATQQLHRLKRRKRQDVYRVIARRPKPRKPGLAIYKTDGVGLALDTIQSEDSIGTDDKARSASAIINTTSVDREGEVIVPTGVDMTNYERNPIVLWEHGWGGVEFPVGKSLHPDGSLALEVGEDQIIATCYFAKGYEPAEQIYDLVRQGVIRATSIHVLPITKSVERVDGPMQQIIVLAESEMLEWSWGAIGVNPEAVGKILRQNRLAGIPILPSIAKSLQRFAPKSRRTRATGKGSNFRGGKAMANGGYDEYEDEMVALDDDEVKALTDDELEQHRKAATEENQEMYDDEMRTKICTECDARKALRDANAGGGGNVEDDDYDAMKMDEDSPLGSQVLTAMRGAISDVVDMTEIAGKQLENPDVKAIVDAEVENYKASLDVLDGAHTATYPDRPTIGPGEKEKALDDEGNEIEEEEEKEPETEAVKAWLASHQRNSFRMAGALHSLKAIIEDKKIPVATRKEVGRVLAKLNRIQSDAKTFRKETSNVADAKSIKELKEQIEGLTTIMKEALPAHILEEAGIEV